ncbi:MAG: 2OG-Fe(II) oxygenase [Acidimicrobiales bacterium]
MQAGWPSIINPLDRDEVRRRVRTAVPFPSVVLDDFLDPAFARSVLDAFPSLGEAARLGRKFRSINARHKIQVTDAETFAEPVRQLHEALASPRFRDVLSHAFSIPDLLADDQLVGGGLHQTGPRGRLDVHVDFNLIEERSLHRRLNILVYFNEGWDPAWGGQIELWNRDVTECVRSYDPVFNRCLIFETSEISFHGVPEVRCPHDVVRRSFAAYYYTAAPPDGWDGTRHSTVFRARPDEAVKGRLMRVQQLRDRTKGRARALLGR